MKRRKFFKSLLGLAAIPFVKTEKNMLKAQDIANMYSAMLDSPDYMRILSEEETNVILQCMTPNEIRELHTRPKINVLADDGNMHRFINDMRKQPKNPGIQKIMREYHG